MRYIGNKTKLLDFIGGVLEERGIAGGTAIDPFCGTASVAAELKRRGFRVVASDIMEYAYVFARAYVQVGRSPATSPLAERLGLTDCSIDGVVDRLNGIDAEPGFIHDQYTPAGEAGGRHGRMYFTPANGARIDTIRRTLHEWRAAGTIDDDTFYVLLAALIEAADRVANTTGVYAAFVKTWQPNALRPIELRSPETIPGNGCVAARADAVELLAAHDEFELLYLDPPYNTRQYAGYYHIPELIAAGWFDGRVRTRGKTGLIADHDKRSDWSRSKRCEEAFESLVATARWKRLVLSYNAEGIIPEPTIERVLRANGRAGTYRRYELSYKRYRSDADSVNRRYRGDTVSEFLYCVDR